MNKILSWNCFFYVMFLLMSLLFFAGCSSFVGTELGHKEYRTGIFIESEWKEDL